MEIVLQGCPYTSMDTFHNTSSPRRSSSSCAPSPIKEYIMSTKKQSSIKPVSKSLSKATGMSFIIAAEEINSDSSDKAIPPPSKLRSKSPAKGASKSLSRASGMAMLKANNMSFESLDPSSFKVHKAYHAGISPSPSFSSPKSRSLSPEPTYLSTSESKSNTSDSNIRHPSEKTKSSIDSNKSGNSKPPRVSGDRGTLPKYRSKSADSCNLLESTKLRTMSPEPSQTSKSRTMSPEPCQTSKSRTMSPEPSQTSKLRTMSPEPSQSSKLRTVSPEPSQTSKSRTMSPEPCQTSKSRTMSPEPSQTSKSKSLSTETSHPAPHKSRSMSPESVSSSSKPRRLTQPKVYSKSLSKATGVSFLKASSMSSEDINLYPTKVPKVSYIGKSSSQANSTTPSKIKSPSSTSKGVSKSLGRASGMSFLKEADNMNNSPTKIPKVSFTGPPQAEPAPKPPTKVPKISYSKSYSEKYLTLPRVSSESKIPVCNVFKGSNTNIASNPENNSIPSFSASVSSSPLKDIVITNNKIQLPVESNGNAPLSKGTILLSRTASSPAIKSITPRDPSPKPIILKVEGPKCSPNATSKKNSVAMISPRNNSSSSTPHSNANGSSKTNISISDNKEPFKLTTEPIYSSVYNNNQPKTSSPSSISVAEPIYAPVVRTSKSSMDPIYSTIASTSFIEPLYSTPLTCASKHNSLSRNTSEEPIYSMKSNTNIMKNDSPAVKLPPESVNILTEKNSSNQNSDPIYSKISNPNSDLNNNSTYSSPIDTIYSTSNKSSKQSNTMSSPIETIYSTSNKSSKQSNTLPIKLINEPVYSVNENNIKNQTHVLTKTNTNHNTSKNQNSSVDNKTSSEVIPSVKDIISKLDRKNINKNVPDNNNNKSSIIAQLASELNVKIQTSPSIKMTSSSSTVTNLPYNQSIYGSSVDTASSKATIVTVSSGKAEGQITSVAPIKTSAPLKPSTSTTSNSPITSSNVSLSNTTISPSMTVSPSSQTTSSSIVASNSTVSSNSTVTCSSTTVSSSTVSSSSTVTPKTNTSMTSSTPVVSAAAVAADSALTSAAPMASTCAPTSSHSTPPSTSTSGTTLAYATTIDFTTTVVYASTKPPGMGPPSSIPDIDSESFKGSSVCIPSDCDSDADLMKAMKKDEPPLLDEEESEMDEEDEDIDNDDDFKIHFPVHSGRKSSAESPKNTPDLLLQISELQEAVVEMKSSLTEAVTRLGSVVEEPLIAREVAESRTRCDNNTSEVLKLVLSLKTDITQLQSSVSSVVDRQESLQNSVQTLLEDRRLLLQDLTQAGVVSLHTRSRLESRNILGGEDGGRAPVRGSQGSGSHSNDSGVALLLERAHQAFTADHNPSPTPTNNRTSDQDSLPEQPSLLVPPSVYDYVAGLRNPASHSTPNSHAPNTHQDNTQNKSSLGVDSGCVVVGGDSEDLGLVYDSDSSLTIAANKTISLSASLSQQCGLELRTASTSADNSHHHHHLNNHITRMHNRSDSDGSDQSRDARHRHKRRSHDHESLEQDGEYSDPCISVDALGPYCLPIDAVGVESNDPYTVVVTSRNRPSTTERHDPRESQRYRVARELLDTEKKYCKTLWTIQDTFADPLKKAGILSHKDITTLFPEEVYQLYDKHCLLQHQLKERLASWKWQPMVGDIVARFTDPRHTDVLRLYTAYVNDFPEVLKTFHKLCRTSPPFTKFIKSCLEQPACGGLDLGAFLLTPVQRVPRYILLMKNLLKYTDPSHPDYQHLHACLERLRDFLARLNDSMEHSFQLVHAQLSHITPGQNHHHSSAPNTVQRPSRSPRRSCSSISSPPVSPGSPSYSPDRSMGRSQTTSPERRQHSPSCSQKSLSSPQRSHSLAASQPSCRPRSVFMDDNRSSSLPRGSASSDSSRQSNSPHSDASRVRSRSESVASRRPLSAHQNCQLVNSQDAPRGTLALARSIEDVSIHDNHETTRWEDLRASEPSLVDSGRPLQNSPKHDISHPIKSRPLTAAHSAHNMSASQQKIVSPTWCDTSASDDLRNKKKSSIRTSIKNMFTFKKRSVSRGRGAGDEGDYWDPATAAAAVAAATAPESISSQVSPSSLATMVGDFVDEEGNPCSNV